MTKLFYDHLIIIEEIVEVLSSHTLTKIEREEILDLVDQALHQEILNTILIHLPKEKHEVFLQYMHAIPHSKKILEFLRNNTSVDIEKEILKTAGRVKGNVHKMIQSSTS